MRFYYALGHVFSLMKTCHNLIFIQPQERNTNYVTLSHRWVFWSLKSVTYPRFHTVSKLPNYIYFSFSLVQNILLFFIIFDSLPKSAADFKLSLAYDAFSQSMDAKNALP